MNDSRHVTIVMIEDDEGHARLIERDDIEPALTRQLQTLPAVGGERDRVAASRERARNEAAEPLVIVDVKNAAGRVAQALASGSGTWMTDRKRPSWRIASAKLS